MEEEQGTTPEKEDSPRAEAMRRSVAGLYSERRDGRADWADWIYEGHVILVADEARRLAKRYGSDPDLTEAAALLHDIADAVMKREDPTHEEKSLMMARELLAAAGFSEEEIHVVVDDAIAKHGCHGDLRPDTLEGKVMAAADAVVHLTSDFYAVAEAQRLDSQKVTSAEIAAWALPKLDRDFINKIAFDDLREEVRPVYERLKEHFSELA